MWRGLLLVLLPVAALAADPVSYKVALRPTGHGDLDAALAGSAQLKTLRGKAPAGPFALVARARQDQSRLETVLGSFGYYDGTIAITIGGHPLSDPNLPTWLAAQPDKPPVPVHIAPTLGPLFHLGRIELRGDVPAVARHALGLHPGDPAVAATVLAAGGRMLNALQEDGYALASIPPPEAVEHPGQHVLDVTFDVHAGPRVDIGDIRFTGLKGVNERFVRRRLLIHSGQLYQPSKIEAARQDLASLGVFSGVEVHAGRHLDASGRIPLVFDVTERKRHAVGFTAGYSTDLGGSVGVTWSDRNLFGNAEQLNLSAIATGLGGNAVKGLGYSITAALIKPDFWARDQQIEFDLGALKQNLDAYDQTAETAGVTLRRKFSKEWTGSLGLTGEYERILQEGVTRNYTLVALPVNATYDSTGLSNPLDDPLHGIRANFSVSPTESLGPPDATFVILQGTAATYFDFARLGLTAPGRSVLALRGLVGSAQGATNFDLPPDQRFYGGGTATVRGFRYQSVGPLFPDNNPIGGAAIDAATIEFRQRIWGPVGGVVFLDAAQVSAGNAPFQGTLREGVGAGLRYYTPIGPIRVDVAVPVNRPPGGDSFELYLGLGQAF